MTAELQLTHGDRSEPASHDEKHHRMPLRYWIMAAILAAFWIFESTIYSVEMAMFPRFITRMAVSALLLLLFLGWWLSNRYLLWRDRLLGVGLLVLGTAVAMALAEPSTRAVVVLSGLPRLFTAWVIWLMIAHNLSRNVQRLGLCAATVLVLGYFTLVRWDGLDGAQRAKLSWRWQPTSEQLFLTSATKAATPTRSVSDGIDQQAAAKPWVLQPGDWPDFRSDHRNGGLPDIEVAGNWSKEPPSLVWRRRVGPAWSSMIVVDGHVVTQEQRGLAEAVVCYDAATGNEIWAHTDADRFEEPLSGPGPRSTPAFADGKIVAIGGRGRLNCLEAATAKLLWTQEGAVAVGQWGLATSPLIVDDLVVVFAGGKSDKSLMSYRAANGELAWARAAGETSYSSPQLVTLGGERQILIDDTLGLHSVAVESGELLWEHLSQGGGAEPMLQPHPLSDRELLVTWGSGIARLRIERYGDRWHVSKLWETTALKPGFNDFLIHEGHIFGLDDGILCCLDAATGQRLWKKGRFGHGQLLLFASPPRLVVVSEAGEVALVAANLKQYEELGRFKAIDGKTWNHPIIASGCLFIRNAEEMACYKIATDH
jgi:outer membrane protein assembly factor BamB